MPTPTYDLIASNVLSSSASSVTFSSLNTVAAGYRDLILVCRVLATDSNLNLTILRFNGDTFQNYNGVTAHGVGGTTQSVSYTNYPRIFLGQAESTSSEAALIITQIMDFSMTDKQKTILNRYSHSTIAEMNAWRWASTNAITSLTVSEFSGYSFASGSTFYLYGIVS